MGGIIDTLIAIIPVVIAILRNHRYRRYESCAQ
jgi:hypothetical protein